MPRWKDKTTNTRTAYNFFIDKGLTHAQTAGIVGNLMQESTPNLNSKIVGSDGTGSLGIAQWLGSRKDGLIKFAQKRKQDHFSLNTQLEYIWHEFHNKEGTAFKKLKATTTPEQAAQVISKYYERPNNNFAHNDKRVNYAQHLFTLYTDRDASAQSTDSQELNLPNNNTQQVISTNTTNPTLLKEMEELVKLREVESVRRREEIKNNAVKSALQEKIQQRNFLSELISNTELEFVERKVTK